MFESIGDFFGGYLHQDWDLDYESDKAAANDFGASESRERVVRVLGEIQLLICLTDEEIETALSEAGNSYIPEGESYRDWLKQISSSIAHSVDGSPEARLHIADLIGSDQWRRTGDET